LPFGTEGIANMHLNSPVLPFVLIGVGVLYLIKPDIFQRWFWKRTAISQQIMTPEQNKVYMRVLGAVFVVVGIVLLVRSGPW
jgi:uncharacterized membrane protein YidH (DUF202 family)